MEWTIVVVVGESRGVFLWSTKEWEIKYQRINTKHNKKLVIGQCENHGVEKALLGTNKRVAMQNIHKWTGSWLLLPKTINKHKKDIQWFHYLLHRRPLRPHHPLRHRHSHHSRLHRNRRHRTHQARESSTIKMSYVKFILHGLGVLKELLQRSHLIIETDHILNRVKRREIENIHQIQSWYPSHYQSGPRQRCRGGSRTRWSGSSGSKRIRQKKDPWCSKESSARDKKVPQPSWRGSSWCSSLRHH